MNTVLHPTSWRPVAHVAVRDDDRRRTIVDILHGAGWTVSESRTGYHLVESIADAILGALALGDLGAHFPDTDPAWKDAKSLGLLARVTTLAAERGWRVGNADVTIVTEAPKLAPHAPAMREELARALGVTKDDVSVKATRHEGLGALGRGEGLLALAVVTVVTKEIA